MTNTAAQGRLILAATPLGQVADASTRLRQALAESDVIAAEDTRRLRTLTTALDVKPRARIVSFYEDVETSRLPALVDALRAGETVLVVTDAGMPSVSDPGYCLVVASIAEEIPVTCLPGPSAVTTALAVSGLPCDRFCFEGFAPRKPGEKAAWLSTLLREPRTIVFFESPHRLPQTLEAAEKILGPDRRIAVCRELTKTYEEIRRGSIAELANWAREGVRGEITVVLAGAAAEKIAVKDLVAEVMERAAAGERLKTVVAEIAETTGVSKKELYDAAITARAQG